MKNDKYPEAHRIDQENLELGLNIHRPGQLTSILKYLTKAAQSLRLLGSDDWADDIEQTAHCIQLEFDEARQRFVEALKHDVAAQQNKSDTL